VLLYKEEDLAVLQTASGLQGEEPLVDRRMYDKGNRQIGSVTSGKGLALVWVLYWAGGFLRGDGVWGVGLQSNGALSFVAVTLPACHDLQDVYHKQELVRTRGIRLFN
jgi:hypothetical protein